MTLEEFVSSLNDEQFEFLFDFDMFEIDSIYLSAALNKERNKRGLL